MKRALALAVVAVLLTPTAASALNRQERALMRMTNRVRVNHGLNPVRNGWRISHYAELHARRMARVGSIYHGTLSWGSKRRCWGQNVGVGSTVWSLFRALMRSPSHRANILGRCFRYGGFGIIRSGGRLWLVQNFAS